MTLRCSAFETAATSGQYRGPGTEQGSIQLDSWRRDVGVRKNKSASCTRLNRTVAFISAPTQALIE
jgi:hypothetical protein